MTVWSSCAYRGVVVHRRLQPKAHAFAYKVFCLSLDLDEIEEMSRELNVLRFNRWGLTSFHDRDFGEGTGVPAAEQARTVLREAGLAHAREKIRLLCYPRVLGYVFNPLSVYFCYTGRGELGAVIYEVSNTFGERKSYVIPAAPSHSGVVMQSCEKEMYVSPFTARQGEYRFRVKPPSDRVLVGVDLHGAEGEVLRTHFRGVREAISDGALLRLLGAHPLMTLKVIGGIHLEAARLWRKGVPLVARHPSPSYSFTVVKPDAST